MPDPQSHVDDIKFDRMGDPLPRFAVTRLGTRRYRCPEPIRCLRISPDGRDVAMTLDGQREDSDNQVLIYDLSTGERVRALSGHENHVHSVDYSADGNTIASTGIDGTIRLWNARTGAALRTLCGTFTMAGAVAFCDDNTLAATHDDSSVRIWDLTTGCEVLVLEPPEAYGLPYVLAVSSDGLTVAAAEIDDVLLWRLDEEEPVNVLNGHEYASMVSQRSTSLEALRHWFRDP